MNVYSQFEGDEDKKLMWLQLDCYHSSLTLIRKLTEQSVGEQTRTQLTKISAIDHRTLQAVHDIFAAAFRYDFHNISGYQKITEHEVLGMVHENKTQKTEIEIRDEWYNWLEHLLENQPEICKQLAKIILNQNSTEGYEAEDKASEMARANFSYISWTNKKNGKYTALTKSGHSKRRLDFEDIAQSAFGIILSIGLFLTLSYYTFIFIAERLFLIPIALLLGLLTGIYFGKGMASKSLMGIAFALLFIYGFYLLTLLFHLGSPHSEPCYINRYC